MTAPASPPVAVGVDELWPVGSWLSAALDDPKVCAEMKRDINEWFDGGGHLRALASPVSGDGSSADADTHRAAEAAVVVWRSPDEVPSVKAGEYAYRIVAVRRAHNGEVYSFGACYLNAVSLWFEDGNESREITGWNSEEGGDEPIYAPLLRDGDDLVGWCEYPIHSAATPQPADGCSSNEGKAHDQA